jgi:hypothetical protein
VPSDAERACEFVAEHVRASSGARWLQGARVPAFACASRAEIVQLFATKRLHKVENAAARALVAWADGARDVVLFERMPAAREVLALQARGARCVSLLGDSVSCAPHESPLAFALHDLCHLEKFVDPEHHDGQVGFSTRALFAMDSPSWRAMEEGFDDAWREDRDHVMADMNGSAVFLFAALKMKLKMAARRVVARDRGEPAKGGGALDDRELESYRARLELLLEAFAFTPDEREAARRVSTRRDDLDAACVILGVFERDGARALQSARSS